MKKRILSLILALGLLVTMAGVTAYAETPTAIQHDISAGSVVINDCGAECPGHIIFGETISSNHNIKILSGSHKVTLRDAYVHNSYPANYNESVIPDCSAIYVADSVSRVDFTVEGKCLFSGEHGLYSLADETNFYGSEGSDISFTGHFEGAFVKNDLTVSGGCFVASTSAYDHFAQHKPHLCALTVGGTLTASDAELQFVPSDFFDTQRYSGGAEDDLALCALKTERLVAKNSSIYATTDDVYANDGIPSRNYSVFVKSDATLDNCELKAEADNASISAGLVCHGTLKLISSYIEATSGLADNISNGIIAPSIDAEESEIVGESYGEAEAYGIFTSAVKVKGGLISGLAEAENATDSAGIFLVAPASFALTDANIFAKGKTADVMTIDTNFAGVVYKADENAAPVVKAAADIDDYFGNCHKLIYDANGVDAEMPEGREYYSYQGFYVSDEKPTADGYMFLGWHRLPDGKGKTIDPERMLTMGDGDIVLYAQWKELEIPPTGDSSAVLHWAVMAAACISILTAVLVFRKKSSVK